MTDWLIREYHTAYAATLSTLQLLKGSGSLLISFTRNRQAVCCRTSRCNSTFYAFHMQCMLLGATPGRINGIYFLAVYGSAAHRSEAMSPSGNVLSHLEKSHMFEWWVLKEMVSFPSRILGLSLQVCWEKAGLVLKIKVEEICPTGDYSLYP